MSLVTKSIDTLDGSQKPRRREARKCNTVASEIESEKKYTYERIPGKELLTSDDLFVRRGGKEMGSVLRGTRRKRAEESYTATY